MSGLVGQRISREQDIIERLYMDEQVRASILEDAIRHVLRYGKLGKQSEKRLRAALFAVTRTKARRVA